MSDIIILANSTRSLSGESALIKSQQRQVQLYTSNNKSAATLVPSKADAEAVLVVDTASNYSYSIPRKIENIADTPPLSLPAPDLKSYHLQARLAYESAVRLGDAPKKLLRISI